MADRFCELLRIGAQEVYSRKARRFSPVESFILREYAGTGPQLLVNIDRCGIHVRHETASREAEGGESGLKGFA